MSTSLHMPRPRAESLLTSPLGVSLVALVVVVLAFVMRGHFLATIVDSKAFALLAAEGPTFAPVLVRLLTIGMLLSLAGAAMLVVNVVDVNGWVSVARPSKGLPAFPYDRSKTQLILAEAHQQTGERSEKPRWLKLPNLKALSTGILVVGATGRGKTSGALYPFFDQLVGLHPGGLGGQPFGGLFIDPKGNAAADLRAMCEKNGRGDDFYEISLPNARYNILNRPDLPPTVQAGVVMQLMRNVSAGSQSSESFWESAASELCAKVLRLIRLADHRPPRYSDLYRIATSEKSLFDAVQRARAWFEENREDAERDDASELEKLEYWYRNTYKNYPATLRGNIAATLTTLCSQFDEPVLERCFAPLPRPDDWEQVLVAKRAQCGELEAALAQARTTGGDNAIARLERRLATVRDQYAHPEWETFEGFDKLIEQGKVVVLSLPSGVYMDVGKVVGTQIKLNFQAAVLGRLARSGHANADVGRPVFMIADEYDEFVTLADGSFLSRCREARCCNILAVQSYQSFGSKLRNNDEVDKLLGNLATKIWYGLENTRTAKDAAELCGKVEREKMSRTVSASSQRSGFSLLDQRSVSEGDIGESASTNWSLREEYLFPPRDFTSLGTFQTIIKAFDGDKPYPPTVAYMRPHFRPADESWFDSPANQKSEDEVA